MEWYFCTMTNEVKELHKIISALILEIEDLKRENKELKQRLARYETPKNSNNSSIPPSKDENRPRHKSLREKSGRKPGGQKDRKGNTLKMVDMPDVVEKHVPEYFNNCGKDISGVNAVFAGKRQVIDIPTLKTIKTFSIL